MVLRPLYYTLVCALGIVASTANSIAQLNDTTVYVVVEHQPEFPGGLDAMKNYLLANVRYTAEAKKAGIKDRVIISFIIEPDGQMTEIRLLKEIGYGCDEEAIRVVKKMPRWTPGNQSGKPLRVKYNLPVLFGMDYPKLKKY